MKKLSLLIILSGVLLSSNAQLNSSFEQWVDKGGYVEPTDWSTTNFAVAIGANQSCRKSSTGHWGQFGMEMSTTFIDPSDTLAAFALQTIPVNKRLNSISFYYKYSGPLQDPGFVSAFFFKGSVTLDNIIGECIFYLTPHTGWTQGKMNVTWTGSGIPDTLTLYISTSQSYFKDTLLIDDIEMSEFGMGIDDNPVLQPLLFVNGQRQLLLHHADDPSNCSIVLRNAVGMEIMQISSMNEPVELHFLPSGVYFYEMILDSGRFMGKVVL